MSKKLLEESTIRQFMKLAKLEPLSDNFLHEKKHEKGLEEEDDPTKPAKPDYGLGKKKTMDATKEADKAARKELTKESEELEEAAGIEEYGDANEEVLDEDLDALFEDELSEMGANYEADDDVEMEAEAGDMEAEINITPDQARAIIAVADMLKDIMPDLEAPEAEDEMDMEEPEMDMDPDAAEADADMAAADADADMAAAEDEEEAADDLAETVMRRVKARLKEMKSK